MTNQTQKQITAQQQEQNPTSINSEANKDAQTARPFDIETPRTPPPANI